MTTRVKSLVCWSLFRVLVPLILLAACVVRYNALSFLYVIFLLVCPLLRSPTELTIKGGTGLYLKLLIVLGALGTLAHIIFHITLAALDKPYGFDFANYVGYLHFSKPSITCLTGGVSTSSAISSRLGNFSNSGSTNDNISRQIAVERLDGVPVINIIRLVVPDLAVLITAILVFVICYVLLKVPEGQDTELPTTASRTRRKRTERFLHFFGTFLVLLFLAASGIIVPSILGAFYFLSFLYISTWWAFYNSLGYKFAVYRFVVLVWSGVHLCVLHLYQFPFFQDLVDPQSLEARIIGLTGIIKTDCERTWYVDFHDASQWPWFVNPGILLLLYFTLAIESRQWLHRKELIIIEEPKARTRKKSRKSSERQVALQDLSQRERLVENENASYSTFDKEGSPAMSAAFESDEDEADGDTKPAKKKKQVKEDVKRPYAVSIFVYAMKQSYVLALIAMMAWSITFHSFLTFVLLLGACIIWMIPKSRQLTLCISPLLVVYGECLLIIQYVFGMNLKTELPEVVNGVKLYEVGLKTFPYPCLQLALQILFTAMFWLTLRQFMRERKERKYQSGYQLEDVSTTHESQSPSARSFFRRAPGSQQGFPSRVDSVDGYDSSTMKKIGKYLWSVLAKYWIFVCAVMMLLISIQEVVIYRIIYMILFLFFVLTFQLSYRLWRLTMFLFWWIVIIYSMAVLIILYTYQFSDFPMYWKNGTHLSDEVLKDIGLEQFNTATLFVKLLTPTSFLIVIILQVHYFHKEFLTISDLNRYAKDSEEVETQPPGPAISDTEGGTTTDTDHVVYTKTKRWRRKLTDCWNKLWQLCSDWWKILSEIFWRLMEIHIFKVVVFVIIMVAVHEVSAVSAVYVIFLAIFLPITGAWPCMAVICQFWTAIVLLAKTIYQLNLVEKDYWITNCTANFSMEPTIIPLVPTVNSSSVVNTTGSPLLANSSGYNSISGRTGFSASSGLKPDTNGTINQALWVGFAKTSHLSHYLSNYIGILLILVLYKLIKCHQSQHYKRPSEMRPPPGVIFPDIKRPEADRGLLRCSKYFANFFFYKFGLQLCYIMLAVTICIRVDVYSVIYAVILGILLVLSRRGNALIWPLITIILAVILPVEFVICLGLPKGLCIEYPWSYIEIFERNLEKWLYLPDYNFPPRAIKLIADTIQLLLICLQWQVFRRESSEGDSHPGGSNKDILEEVEASTPILVPDFTGHAKSYLDVLKIGFFTYMYWVTLFIMFITGATRINLFSMGYVIAVFVFMWYGQEFLLLPLRTIRRRWNMLIGYTFFVLFMKAVLQLLGCVYIDKLYTDQCWLIQLLGLTCLNPSHIFNTGDCKVEEDDTGLAWDVICFTFLLLQMRIYNSHYFRHVVVMNQAQHNLASRGAELINQTLIESVLKQKEEERQVLDNIKKKMDAIKEKQKHVKKDFVVPDEHFQTIRSGDYYLFDEESESEEETGGKKVKDSITIGQDEEEDDTPNPLQLISTAIHSGPDAAIDQAEDAADKDKDKETKDKEQGVEDEEEDIIDKTGTVLKFIQKLLESLFDSIIEVCNGISKNYRMVADQLEDEMNKERQGIRSEHKALDMKDQSIELEGPIEGSAEDGQPTSTDLVEIQISSPDEDVKKIPSDDSLDGKKQDKFEQSKSKVYLLLEALYYLLISRTELICYFLMILDQIVYASLLSLPLPLMVFLWGMLSVPRPSKSFWITAITYTEAIIVVKYLFQFGFWPWNKDQTNLEPFYPPRIIGIEQIDGYATVDLILLLALFIHRSILKRYGLWKDAEEINSDFDKVEKEISPHGSPVPKREDTDLVVSGSTVQSSGAHSSIEESLEDPNSKKKKAEMSMLGKLVNPFKDFYNQVTNPDYNATTDVYASMFFCDFINFFIVVFGYTAFGPQQSVGTGDVSSYIQEDKVPIPFLIMLVVQFILIIIDRALYLRKNVLGKFIFQIVLVILLHVWMFFVLPEVTKRKFSENRPAQLWYFVKCIYFGLSAYQIRSSYPTRILGNFLTKKYNYLNLFLYKGFLAIPFLLELRVLMDWIWTDTTMAIGSWLQMEDIYANVYQLKCWRDIERNYPTPRGFKKKSLIKYGVGGLLLVIIIFIIWFPLVIFSFANTVFKVNPPTECTVTMTINGFQPIYKMTVQTEGIRALSSAEYKTLKETFNGNLNAIAFLTAYEPEDVTEIVLNGQSTSLWGISPPSKDELIKQLSSSTKARLEFHATFLRTPASASAGDTLSFQIVRTLDSHEQTMLRDILTNATQSPLNITKLFPRFLKIPSKGAATGIKTLNDGIGLSKVQMNLQGNDPVVEWWKVDELMTGTVISPSPGKSDKIVSHISLITFNARVAPSGFSFITNYGIIGLYISFILLIGRILRLSTSGLIGNITYNELPYIDNALQLCLDLYLVREMGEFRLEEDLYAKLIFFYRSAETRVKWTRLPNHLVITDAKKND